MTAHLANRPRHPRSGRVRPIVARLSREECRPLCRRRKRPRRRPTLLRVRSRKTAPMLLPIRATDTLIESRAGYSWRAVATILFRPGSLPTVDSASPRAGAFPPSPAASLASPITAAPARIYPPGAATVDQQPFNDAEYGVDAVVRRRDQSGATTRDTTSFTSSSGSTGATLPTFRPTTKPAVSARVTMSQRVPRDAILVRTHAAWLCVDESSALPS